LTDYHFTWLRCLMSLRDRPEHLVL